MNIHFWVRNSILAIQNHFIASLLYSKDKKPAFHHHSIKRIIQSDPRSSESYPTIIADYFGHVGCRFKSIGFLWGFKNSVGLYLINFLKIF